MPRPAKQKAVRRTEVFSTHDLIIPRLAAGARLGTAQEGCHVTVTVTPDEVTVTIGPRDITWDRQTGRATGGGTFLG